MCIYLICAVDFHNLVHDWDFLSQHLAQGWVKTWSKMFYCFSQIYSVFAPLKNQMSAGVQQSFFLLSRSQKGFSKTKELFVLVLFMLKKEKEEYEKNGKTENLFFGGGRALFCCKNGIL